MQLVTRRALQSNVSPMFDVMAVSTMKHLKASVGRGGMNTVWRG